LEIILAQDRQANGKLSAELAASSTLIVSRARFFELELNLDPDKGSRDLTLEVKAMAKELREATTNATELEIELANAQER